MKVLLVNHTSKVSGAEHSMMTFVGGLPDDVRARLACPLSGPLEQLALGAGLTPFGIRGGDAGLRLHPTGTPTALAGIGVTSLQVAAHARRMGAELLHANSIRAGLIAISAGGLLGRPVVVHLRDELPRGRGPDAILRLLAARADGLIAISQHIAERFLDVVPSAQPRTVHNAVDLDRFDPDTVDGRALRVEVGVRAEATLLAVVGQISPWKGQLEAVQALAALSNTHPDVNLLIVGEVKFAEATTSYDNVAYLAEVRQAVTDHGLAERVHFLGERRDIAAVLAASDLALVPSWSEPFGRVVIEAMAMGTPVLATRVGGPPEIITDYDDGRLLSPRDPPGWAAAVAELCDDPALRERLGRAARRRAAEFGVGPHVDGVLDVYREVLRGR